MLYDHALHSICIFKMFHAFRCVLGCWKLCVVRFGLGWTQDVISFCTSHVHAFFMHTYPFFSCWYFVVIVFFCFSPSLSFSDRLRMAPKCKSTSSRNPLRSGTSSSDPTPIHVQFRDEKAHKDFSENFSKHGVHSEHHVILSDFSNTTLPIVIHSRGWESL